MTISFWRLGGRTLWRDLRSGELRLLMVAVTLAVAALTAVGFFADRLQGGLQRDARQLLGGDAVVATDRPAPAVFAQEAKRLGLAQAQTLGFQTMSRAPDALGGASKLVSLKAVEAGYPLRGTLGVSDSATGPVREQTTGPAPGTVWVDASVLDALAVHSILSRPHPLTTVTLLTCNPTNPSSIACGIFKPKRNVDRFRRGVWIRCASASTPSRCLAKASHNMAWYLAPPRMMVRATPVAWAYSSTMCMFGLPTLRCS